VRQEQPTDVWPRSEEDTAEEGQPATPDLYSDDVGDVDGPNGLIDQDGHFDDSSEDEELNAVAADVRNAENLFVSRKKRKTKARVSATSSPLPSAMHVTRIYSYLTLDT